MNATPVAVGVDNGGTWIRICIKSSPYRTLRRIQKKSPSVDKLAPFLRRTLAPFTGRVASLTVASKGIWKPAKRQSLQRELSSLSAYVRVMSDVEGAWLAAFSKSRQGIVLIAGTGSIAYGRTRRGSFARAGGLGPARGDEGSGFWIGKEWKRAQRAPWKSLSVRAIASLAPRIIDRARQKDPVASQIIAEAQAHLVALIRQVAKKFRMKSPIPVALHGRVLGNASFRKGFLFQARMAGCRMRLVRASAPVAEVLASPLS